MLKKQIIHAVTQDYVLRRIRHESEAIEECERSIATNRDESEQMKDQIAQLKGGFV